MNPGWTRNDPELIDAVQDLWRQGWSGGSIAECLKVTRNIVMGIVSRGRERDGVEHWPHRRLTEAHRKSTKHASPEQLKPFKNVKVQMTEKRLRTIQQKRNADQWIAGPTVSIASDFHPQPIRFMDRTLDRCAFPIDGEPGPDMQCCGAKVRDIGGVYCDYHCSICFGRELAPVKVEEAA